MKTVRDAAELTRILAIHIPPRIRCHITASQVTRGPDIWELQPEPLRTDVQSGNVCCVFWGSVPTPSSDLSTLLGGTSSIWRNSCL